MQKPLPYNNPAALYDAADAMTMLPPGQARQDEILRLTEAFARLAKENYATHKHMFFAMLDTAIADGPEQGVAAIEKALRYQNVKGMPYERLARRIRQYARGLAASARRAKEDEGAVRSFTAAIQVAAHAGSCARNRIMRAAQDEEPGRELRYAKSQILAYAAALHKKSPKAAIHALLRARDISLSSGETVHEAIYLRILDYTIPLATQETGMAHWVVKKLTPGLNNTQLEGLVNAAIAVADAYARDVNRGPAFALGVVRSVENYAPLNSPVRLEMARAILRHADHMAHAAVVAVPFNPDNAATALAGLRQAILSPSEMDDQKKEAARTTLWHAKALTARDEVLAAYAYQIVAQHAPEGSEEKAKGIAGLLDHLPAIEKLDRSRALESYRIAARKAPEGTEKQKAIAHILRLADPFVKEDTGKAVAAFECVVSHAKKGSEAQERAYHGLLACVAAYRQTGENQKANAVLRFLNSSRELPDDLRNRALTDLHSQQAPPEEGQKTPRRRAARARAKKIAARAPNTSGPQF